MTTVGLKGHAHAKRARPRSKKVARAAAVPSPPARQRDAQATRAVILDCAVKIFAERGYEGATTRDIAALAGVNHALIKYYFGNKLDLWKAMFKSLVAGHGGFPIPTPDESLSEAEAVRAVKSFVEEFIRYQAAHPELARIVIQETIRDNERLAWAVEHYFKSGHARLERLFRWMQERGILPRVSIPALVFTIVGASQLYYVQAAEVRRTWHIDPMQERHIQDHIDAVLVLLFPQLSANV